MKFSKISREKFKYFLLIFFSLKIGCLSYVSSTINLVWFCISILTFIYTFSVLIINKKINKFDMIVFLFYFILIFSTLINSGSINDLVKEVISFFSLYYVIRYGIEKNAKDFVNVFSKYIMFLTLTNTLSTIIYYPSSMFRDNNNPIFFCGGDNTAVRLYLIAILFYFMNCKLNKKKIKFPFLPLLNLLVFSIIRDLGGGKVCFMIMFLGILYLMKGTKMPKKVMKNIILVNILLFILLVITNKMEIFKFLIVNVLHRNLSLTDRTVIWDITINKIFNKPIIGYGMIDGLKFQSMLPYITGINAHNTYLMILFDGGIVLFSVFLLIMIFASVKFDKIKHDRWIYIMPITLLALMIRAQIEGWDVMWLIILAMLIYMYLKFENVDNKVD